MGGIQSVDYPTHVVQVRPPEEDGESGVFVGNAVLAEGGGDLFTNWPFTMGARSPLHIMKKGAIRWPNSDCMGERAIAPDGSPGPYKWTSWKDSFERFIQFGRGLTAIGVKAGDRVGIYGSNSIWWQTVNFGTHSIGAVTVPVYDSLGPQASEYVCGFAGVEVLFVNEHKFENALALAASVSGIRVVAILGTALPDSAEAFASRAVTLTTSEAVLAQGVHGRDFGTLPDPESVALIMFTSGSTGTPKGVPLTHANIVAGSCGLSIVGTSCNPDKDTYLSFLPLAHIYAYAVELEVWACGGRVGYARGGVAQLMSDVAALQPTIMTSAPRVLNRIAEAMKAKIAQKPVIVQKILGWIQREKMRALKDNRAHSLICDIALAPMRAALGGRMKVLISGGAPVMPEILEFCCTATGANIFQGMGMTECSSSMFVQSIPIRDSMSVGSICPCAELKLRRVPEMDYDPRAAEPAGEALVRGPMLFKGYYKQDELTAEAFDERGWFATGDVVTITKENQVRVIDRAKQLIKLSQGEYVSLSQLTEFYGMASVVSFIFVWADGRYDEPIAIVWPKAELIAQWEGRRLDVEKASEVHDAIIASLREVFVQRKLRGFERINHVLVRKDEPTVDNGLLTPTLKAQQKKLAAKYHDDLIALYKSFSKV